jgi:hypothetical protein
MFVDLLTGLKALGRRTRLSGFTLNRHAAARG